MIVRFLERTPRPWPAVREDRDEAPSHERLPGVLGATLPTPVGAFAPALDLEEDEDAYTIYAELPGVSADDLGRHRRRPPRGRGADHTHPQA